MKRAAALSLAVAVLVLVGCGDSHEKVINDMVGVIEETTAVLKTVKTEADAKAAAPKLEEIQARAKGLEKRMKDLGDPPKAEQERLGKLMMDKMFKALGEFQAESMRIAMNPELFKHLEKQIEGVGDAFKN